MSCTLPRETEATAARCTGPVMPRRDGAPSRKRRRSRSGARWIGESQEIAHPPSRSLRKQSSRRAGRSARGPSFRRVVSTIVYLLQKSIDDVDCPTKPHVIESSRAVNGGIARTTRNGHRAKRRSQRGSKRRSLRNRATPEEGFRAFAERRCGSIDRRRFRSPTFSCPFTRRKVRRDLRPS